MTIINFWACVISAWMTIFNLGTSNWVVIQDTIVFVSFVLDISFTICKKYRDVSGQLVTSHKLILTRYVRSGWFFIDVVSTFPFQLLGENSNGYIAKLLRLLHIPRIVKVFQLQNFNQIVKYFQYGSTRAEKIKSAVTIRKVYQIITLISMTLMTVYFIGVLFYFATSLTLTEIGGTVEDSFKTYIGEELKNEYVLATLIYYSMTTLAKIGYGDFFPLSDAEKLYTLVVLLFSLVFFSFLLDRFIDILQNSPSAESTTQTVDTVSEKIDLFTWLT